MELEIDFRQSPPGIRLLEPGELRSFAVAVIESAGHPPAAWPEAVARREEHAWIRIDALRELAAPHVDAAWEPGFEQMLEFARSRGWVDEELRAVRGHVVRRAAAGAG
jgi:hypothetical protein